MPNSQNESVPIPWLSATLTGDASTPGQAWSPSSGTLVVSYPFVKREFFQRLLYYLRRNARKNLWVNTAIGFVCGALPLFILIVVMRNAPGLRYPAGSSIWRWLLVFWAGMTLAAPALSRPLSYFMCALTAQMTARTAKGRQFTVILSRHGVEQRFDLTRTLRWSDVRGVEMWDAGGILIVGAARSADVGVPDSAFPDADAKEQFLAAARILWESQGDVSLVPEPIRNRFTPGIGIQESPAA